MRRAGRTAVHVSSLAVGVLELVNVAMKAVRKSGTISLFAGFSTGAAVTIDPNLVHYGQIRIAGASGATGDFTMLLTGPDSVLATNDCNGNGAPDECDIADGTSQDVNGNGIPDECE